MNINSVEQSLAKYHLLHFVIGVILTAVLLAVPKFVGAIVCVFTSRCSCQRWCCPSSPRTSGLTDSPFSPAP